MGQYKRNILGASETRWTGLGSLKVSTGESVLFSGREDDYHREGVAIILKSGVKNHYLEWKPIISRIVRTRNFLEDIPTSVIQC